MNAQTKKCVMVIDGELGTGLIANTAAVLALTLGEKLDGISGPDVIDGSQKVHIGITTIPIPILRGTRESIRDLHQLASSGSFLDILIVDFSNAAQTTTTYDDYTQKISRYTTDELEYLGVALYGDKKMINRLTGSLPLLR